MSKNRNQKRVEKVYVNNGIRSNKVRCIGKDNENLGVLLKSQAIAIAEDHGLDLVQVSKHGDIPTCKILDYGKYKYDLSKKERVQAKKQRDSAVKQKEIKLRPSTDIHDLKTKAKRITDLIASGCRVKVSVYFKGRELQHKRLGPAKLEEILGLLEDGTFKIDQPKFEGRTVSVMVESEKNVKERLVKKAS